MKTLSNIREGFYKNVGVDDKILREFLKDQIITVLKGKEYIIFDGRIYDVDDLRSVYYCFATGENRKPQFRNQFKNEMKKIEFIGNHIRIEYIVHSTTGKDYYEAYKFDSICGNSLDVKHRDENLKKFLESL